MINEGSVSQEVKDGIATITFEHPAHNSLPGPLLKELQQSIDHAGHNQEVKIILLKSGGNRTFCAGASFDELIAIDDPQKGKEFFKGFANVINACRKSSKIIIGRVQGKAVGGGVGLASAVDYCFATKFASIKLSELAVGIGPFVIGPAVERKIGTSHFSQLALDATEWRTAHWAQDKGLFSEVFEDAEAMDNRINEFSLQLASSNPEALSMLKSIFWKGTEEWENLLDERAAMSGKLVLSDFTKNAIEKFKMKT